MQTDWVGLADAQLWGVLIAILVVVAMVIGFVIYLLKPLIVTNRQTHQYTIDQMKAVAFRASGDLKEANDRTNTNQETMMKITQDMEHAITSMDKTMQHMANVVARCPYHNGEDRR